MQKTWKQWFKSALVGMVLGVLIPSVAFPQATLLPNAKQQYLDDSANPVSSGEVYYYVPNTSTKKTIWQDSGKVTPQSNPVLLDAAGRPQPDGQTYGDGSYRQVVKDQNGNTIWDAVTSSTGSSSGGTSPAWSEGVMVGTIVPWANTTLPSKYLYTAGQAISRSTYDQLLTALTYSTPILCQSGIATITVSTTISDSIPIGAPIEASCFAPGTVVFSKSSGSLTMSTNATTTTSVNAVLFPWGNGDGTTTFNIPDLRGKVLAGRNNMLGSASSNLTSSYFLTPGGVGVNPNAVNAQGGSESYVTTTSQLPTLVSSNASQVINTLSTATGVPLNAIAWPNMTTGGGGSNGILGPTSGTVAVNIGQVTSTGTNSISVSTVGTTSTPHPTVGPMVTSDYIIKALPDDLPSGPGVTSLGGMTGSIACGTGLTCTANTISVSISSGTVTSVALTAPSIFTVGGSPITTSGTITLTANGISGGVPYFNSTTTMASSAFLAANAFMIGGGAGGAPSTVALTGLVVGNGASAPTAYGGVTCTNQFLRALSAAGAGSCATVSLTADVTGTLPLAQGGTANTTALAARGSTGLNIDGATATGDANYTILATDRMVYHTALSAARTDTLPAANAVNAGQVFYITDFRGVASASNTVTLQQAGSDTINGVSSVVAINAQYGAGIFWSDGISRWTYQPVAASGGGGTMTQVTPGAGLVSSVTAACSQTAITTTGTLYGANCINAQTGTTYTVLDTDRHKLVTLSNAAAVAVTLPQAGAASAFQSGWSVEVRNQGVSAATSGGGFVTITPTTSTINGFTSLVLPVGRSVVIFSDGTNYQATYGRQYIGSISSAEYGVLCDGSTSDATAFQAFVTALSAAPYPKGIVEGRTGGSVCHMGTTAIDIGAKANIECGTRQTTLKWTSAGTSRMLRNLNGSSDKVVIKNCIIDGTTKASQLGIYIYGNTGAPNSPSQWIIEGVTIQNVSDCIYMDAGGSTFASNYHTIISTTCATTDTGASFVSASNSNTLIGFRCSVVTSCVVDNGNNNKSIGGAFELVTTGLTLNASSAGFSSFGDRYENTPTSGTGITTVAGATKVSLTNPHFAGLTTNVNDAANAIINSQFEYKLVVSVNIASVAAASALQTSITTAPLNNCTINSEPFVSSGGNPANILYAGIPQTGGIYINTMNPTGSAIDPPAANFVLGCRVRS